MSEVSPAEIRALVRLIDELSYYDILELAPDASAPAVRMGYHAASRRFHPDGSRHLPVDVRENVDQIAKRVTEAYSVLRDPRKRKIYDAKLGEEGDGARIQLVEAQQVASQTEDQQRNGSTPNGRRFFAMARTDHQRGNLDNAIRNLQMALTYESDNSFFKETLASWKAERD